MHGSFTVDGHERAMNSPKPLINLLRGWPNPGLLPTAALKSAALLALSDTATSVQGLTYGPDCGYEPLRVQLSSWLTGFYKPEKTNEPARLCITGGASQNLANILQVYSDPIYTKNIWMVSPTYFLACRIFEDAGFPGRLRSVPEDESGIDVEYLQREIAKQETNATKDSLNPSLKRCHSWDKKYRHIIYTVPTYSNPSSRTMTLKRRRQLVGIARNFDALIVTDDVYDQLQWTLDAPSNTSPDPQSAVQPRIVDVDRFSNGGPERPGADGFGNSVSSGSFSKIAGPGCRTGWAEGTTKFAYGLSQLGSNKSGGAPSQLTATILSKFLENNGLQQHITTVLQPSYARRYSLLIMAIEKHLRPLGVQCPQVEAGIMGGYYLWLSLPSSLRATEVADRAKEEENVIVGSGSLFGVIGDVMEDGLRDKLRLCFAWEDEELLEKGVEKLGAVVRRALIEAKNVETRPLEKCRNNNTSGSLD